VTKRTRCAAAALIAAVFVAALAGTASAGDPLHLMPESASAEADTVDGLTYMILWITGITFVGVEALLVIFLFKYRARPGQKAKFTHGNHAVEMVWTVVPALILVFLAVYQMGLWIELKKPFPEDNRGATQIQVVGKQFEWNGRYAGPDGKFGTADDRLTVSAFVVPVNRPVNVQLRSLDVIHSFFLPHFRFKQDAVPGLTIPFWFKPTRLSASRLPVTGRDFAVLADTGQEKWIEKHPKYWDVVCAELCGNGHTNMAAQLWVVSEEDYAKWLNDPASVPGLPAWSVWHKDNPLNAADKVWVRWHWQDMEKRMGPDGKYKLDKALLNREPFGHDEKSGGDAPAEDM
jgi:cytochrome c oxidase subunit 2